MALEGLNPDPAHPKTITCPVNSRCVFSPSKTTIYIDTTTTVVVTVGIPKTYSVTQYTPTPAKSTSTSNPSSMTASSLPTITNISLENSTSSLSSNSSTTPHAISATAPPSNLTAITTSAPDGFINKSPHSHVALIASLSGIGAVFVLLGVFVLLRLYNSRADSSGGWREQQSNYYNSGRKWSAWSIWPWRRYSVREIGLESDEKRLVPQYPHQGVGMGIDPPTRPEKSRLVDFYSADIQKLVEEEEMQNGTSSRGRASEVTVSVRMDRGRGRERDRRRDPWKQHGYWPPDNYTEGRNLNYSNSQSNSHSNG